MEVSEVIENLKSDTKEFIQENPNWVLIIWWATATWKSKLSLMLDNDFDIEIISADSRQVYKYMDIWTDKIPESQRKSIPHYQIDIVTPDEFYTAWEWKQQTEELIQDIQNRWKIPVIVWWTGLYIDTIYKNFTMPDVEPDFQLREKLYTQEKETPWYLHTRLNQLDPQQAQKIHPNSQRHLVRAIEIFEKTWKTKSELAQEMSVKWPLFMAWLRREKEDTNRRINKRIKEMFQQGLVQEVQNILDMWYSQDLKSMQWIWYKEILWYLNWDYKIDRAEELLKRNTHRFAKRQRSWFRRYIAESKSQPKENVWYRLYNLS